MINFDKLKWGIFPFIITVLLVTGSTSNSPRVRLQAVDGTWNEENASFDPPARLGHAMVFDSIKNKTWMFGGIDGMTIKPEEMWSFNSTSNNWSGTMTGTPMDTRFDSSMVFAEAWSQVILFGGQGSSGLLNDTWGFDLDFTWTRLMTFNDPINRSRHAMAFDNSSFQMLMFGGHDNGVNYLGDTWTLDGMYQWIPRVPALAPSPRGGHAMVYDSKNDLIVLFGGKDDTTVYDDVWTYDMDTHQWSPTMVGVRPPARSNPSLAYDSDLDLVVMYGGNNGSLYYDDTWTFNITSNVWNQVMVAGPGARTSAQMVYDSNNKLFTLYGGSNGTSSKLDTWSLSLTIIPTTTTATTSTIVTTTTATTSTTVTTTPDITNTQFTPTVTVTDTTTETLDHTETLTREVPGPTVTVTSTETSTDASVPYPILFAVIPLTTIFIIRKKTHKT